MKSIMLLIFLISNSIAYEKAFIDTHGGNTDPLVSKKSSFSSILGLTKSKDKKINKSNIYEIDKIDKIDKIDEINKENK